VWQGMVRDNATGDDRTRRGMEKERQARPASLAPCC
jgi:hypothetical protein